MSATNLQAIIVAISISMVVIVLHIMYDRHKNIKALQRSKLLAAQLPIYIHQHVRNTWPGAEQYCDVTHNGSDEKPIKIIIEGRKFILYDPDTKTTYQTIEELHAAGY